MLLAVALSPVDAVDLRDVLTDYTSTNFGRKDGISGPVWAMMQDADGFLWIGTDDGLIRFDGLRFRPWDAMTSGALPKLSVRALHLGLDGSLWVGFGASGGVTRISGRTVTVFTDADHAGTGAVAGFDHDSTGALWVAGANGVFQFAGGTWQRFGEESGLPDAPVLGIRVDGDDAVWAGTMAGLFRRPGRATRFEQVEPAAESLRSLSLSVGPDKRMWISDVVVGFRPVGSPPGRPTPPASLSDPPSGRGFRLIHDRRGDLWVATIGQGLWRVRLSNPSSGPFIERTTVLSGLSSDAVRSVYEDRDGNIWAGTTDGLDRFVPHRITPWAGLGIIGTVTTTVDGRVWIGTEDDLLLLSKTGETWQLDPTRLRVGGPRVIRGDARGGLWAMTTEEFLRIEGTVSTRVPFPPRFPVSWTEAVAADPTGGLWVAALGGVILHDAGGRFQVVDQVDAIKDTRVVAALGDRLGQLWLAYGNDRVGVWSRKGEFRGFGAADGLGAGPYYSMLEDSLGRIWVASASSLSRFDGQRFANVTPANGLPATGALSLIEDNDHHLWLASTVGILRLSPAEFDAAILEPRTPMHFRLYDTSDGLAGFPALIGTDRNAVRSHDGMLWFITSRGLSMLDPMALDTAYRAPKVTIDEVRADDRVVTDHHLPPGTAKIEVAYTAPELTHPLKTRFRYRLDGWDTDWVEAGNQRQVLYTNLPPRAYTFHVAVTGDEGRWSDAAATVDFSIAPRFYQTLWFYPVSALVVGGLIAGAWRLRLRALRRQFSLVLGERVRLSRELHDTLLQSLVGVALEFDAVAKSLDTSPATAKARVVKIREHVEEYIREARRSIWSLRSTALETGDLLEALKESAERATSNHGVELAFHVEGTPRRLPPQIEHQVLRIGQEAMLNAVRHAQASHLDVRVSYEPHAVVLQLKDDGVGFDPEKTAEGTTDHYGIITMRERAQQAGGDVTIISAPGRGTTVEARVPTTAFAPQEAHA